jgi:hypothetical protein
MRAVLLHRGETAVPQPDDLRARGVAVIRSLTELSGVLERPSSLFS